MATTAADGAAASSSTGRDYLRVATEEAWAPAEMLDRYRRLLASRTIDDPGFQSLWGFYLGNSSERPRSVIERLQDVGARRVADMDASGVDVQVLSLTSPGVQGFDGATANP